MRSLKYAGIALCSMLMAVSCSQEELVSNDQQQPEENFTLTVNRQAESRTWLPEEGFDRDNDGTADYFPTYWSKEDRIHVASSDREIEGRLRIVDGVDGTNAQFSGLVNGPQSMLAYAVYPLLDSKGEIDLTARSYKNPNAPMIGTFGNDKSSVDFETTCGMFRLVINDYPANTNLIVEGPGISGKAKVVFNETTQKYELEYTSDGKNKVKITETPSEVGKVVFYVPVITDEVFDPNVGLSSITPTSITIKLEGTDAVITKSLHIAKQQVSTSENSSFLELTYHEDTDELTEAWDGKTESTSLDFTQDVIEIHDAAELKAFADYVNDGNRMDNQTVRLVNDIDLNNKEWTPIGLTTSFKGTFDGDDKTIKNVKVVNDDKAGLFGILWGATIMDLNIENISVSGKGIVGKLSAVVNGDKYATTTINNVKVTNTDNDGLVGDVYATNKANPLLKIDGVFYANKQGVFENTLNGATGDMIIKLYASEYILLQFLPENRTITFIGAGKEETNLKGTMNAWNNNQLPGNYATGSTLKFKDLTYTTINNGYSGGFGHTKGVEFYDSKIVGQFYAHSNAPHKFVDCTIDPLNGYLYTYASNCDFEGCTFTASEGKALQVYAEAAGEFTTNITNCTFTAAKQATTYDGKPVTGIDVNSANGGKMRVNITNCTTTGFPVGLNSGSDLWNVKSTTADIIVYLDGLKVWDNGYKYLVDGVMQKGENDYAISNRAGLEWMSAEVAKDNRFTGKTVKLTENIDLAGENWEPIGNAAGTNYTHNFEGTFDGNGKTISNLAVNNTKCAGLFGRMCKGAIKNLTIDGATLTTNHYAGAIVAWMEQGGGAFTLDNCHVKDVTITVTPDGEEGAYDNGDKAGAIAGFMRHGTINNCSATDVEITAYRDLGGIVGYVYSTTVTNNKVENATLTVDQKTNYYGDKNPNAGPIIGRRDGTPTESNNTHENVNISSITVEEGNFNKVLNGGSF